jgi:hypothetical protein
MFGVPCFDYPKLCVLNWVLNPKIIKILKSLYYVPKKHYRIAICSANYKS